LHRKQTRTNLVPLSPFAHEAATEFVSMPLRSQLACLLCHRPTHTRVRTNARTHTNTHARTHTQDSPTAAARTPPPHALPLLAWEADGQGQARLALQTGSGLATV